MSTYLSLILFWVIFFVMHSITASSVAKDYANTRSPIIKSYYRLGFNLLSLLLLIPVVYTYFSLPLEYVLPVTLVKEIIGLGLIIFGTYILIAGFKNYRTDEFIGTYQAKNHHEFHPTKLSRSGWNGVVRHPLYFGGILIIIGLFLMTPTIKLGLTGLLTILYLYIGSLWEEKKLVKEFGKTYTRYQQEVSMLLPIKWIQRKIG